MEGRLDVRDQGWRLAFLEGCDEPGGVLVLRRIVKGCAFARSIG